MAVGQWTAVTVAVAVDQWQWGSGRLAVAVAVDQGQWGSGRQWQ